ncbi:MAG: hypothetical protein RMK90_05260 [Acetobacteraceae bacterium]|nr:hypothetical protein [Acetobacteraceae bacterium]
MALPRPAAPPLPRPAAPPLPEAPPRPAAVVALSAAPADLPQRLAELSAQHGPYGLPLARGAFRAVVAGGDARAPWRFGRSLPFEARLLPPGESSPRAAALSLIGSEAPEAALVLPAPGAPIPPDLLHSLLAGLGAGADACLRQDRGAVHLALRPGLARLLPEGGEMEALARGGFRVARAAPVPQAPALPERPGWFERWLLRRLELA